MQRSALCRSRRELFNAYFLAKFGFDTAENEPCKVCAEQHGSSRSRSAPRSLRPGVLTSAAAGPEARVRRGLAGADGEDASGRQTLEGSFSAVSKPNFASKYLLESSRRDLHNALLCNVL